MTYSLRTLLIASILISAITSCRQAKYEIIHAKESQSKSVESFVECKLIETAQNGSDTILYYRLNLDSAGWQFTQSPKLNVGFRLTNTFKEHDVSYNYVYLATQPNERTDSLIIDTDINKLQLLNYRKENGNKRSETSFGLGNDPNHPTAIWSKQVTNPKYMVDFVHLFHEELRRSLKHGNELVYTTVAHVGGYSSTTEMLVEFK